MTILHIPVQKQTVLSYMCVWMGHLTEKQTSRHKKRSVDLNMPCDRCNTKYVSFQQKRNIVREGREIERN